MKLKNNLKSRYKSEANFQDLQLSKLNFNLDKSKSTFLKYKIFLEKLNRPNSCDIDIKIGRKDIEISKGNFYFPLKSNFRVN